MIWGYKFKDIENHLQELGFRRVRTVSGIVLFIRGRDEVFTIREPNVFGSIPENRVLDAFDNANLPPPEPAVGYVD